jgi:hypothetical protein
MMDAETIPHSVRQCMRVWPLSSCFPGRMATTTAATAKNTKLAQDVTMNAS